MTEFTLEKVEWILGNPRLNRCDEFAIIRFHDFKWSNLTT